MENKIINKNNLPYYLIAFAIFTGLTCPMLFSDGMFMDGLYYSVISRNLANGQGSFWSLYLSDTFFSNFHEHPPLVMGIQSIFFKIFGDSIFIERFYSFVTAIASGFLIIIIWRKLTEGKHKNYAWIPLLFWVLFPTANWAYSNNLLENTVTVFVLMSSYFVIISFNKNRFLMLFLSGICISLALLSKGFTALFPWTLISFYWISTKKISFIRALIDNFLLIVFSILPILILVLLNDNAYNSLSKYVDVQVINSIKNVKTVDYRFWIVEKLLNELLIMFGMMLVIFLIVKFKKIKIKVNQKNIRYGIFFILLGLSGVLPIMISMKQRAFYILPTFPFFAIGLAFFIINYSTKIFGNINIKTRGFAVFKYISIFLCAVAFIITISFAGKIKREKDTISDIYSIIDIVPQHTTISICESMRNNWSLYGYFYRYGYISLDNSNEHEYYLTDSECIKNQDNYKKIDIELKSFNLFKRVN